MSPLWARKKLVHFLRIRGLIILSHSHINAAPEKAWARQHSQAQVSQGLAQTGGEVGFTQTRDSQTVCPGGGLPGGAGGTVCSLPATFSIVWFSPRNILISCTSSKTMNPLSWEGRLAVAAGLAGENWPGWAAAQQREAVHRANWGRAQSPVPRGPQPGFLGPPECQGAPMLARSLAPVAGNH